MQVEDYFEFIKPDDIRIKGHRLGIEHVLEEQEGYLYPILASPRYLALSLEFCRA